MKQTNYKRAGAMPASGSPRIIRCAIYTRKSTEEGLQQEFNTLDAQRESAEAYVASMKHEGWVCLPTRYDDGGFTGGNLDRPAVQRLMADIQADLIDCVVVYKVDRLSRSLMDFSRMMETFDKHGISFVSVTQQFNTTHSMGRLTLNILLSFAQFEREIISERTRDKIAAARRKGKFSGGRPVLGYDVLRSPAGPKLVVSADEAAQVRRIYTLYLQHGSLIPVVTELDQLGWCTKQTTQRNGKAHGGRPFDKMAVYQLLTNVLYVGKVRYKDEVHPGQHEAIVDETTWQKVQTTLGRNGRSGGALVRNKHGALLKGILRCGPCACSMGHTYTADGTKRYRYYVCLNAQKRGWANCPSKSIPAGEIEAFVVEQIKGIGKDQRLVAATVQRAKEQQAGKLAHLRAEHKRLNNESQRDATQLRQCIGVPDRAAEMADLQERLASAEQRIGQLQTEIDAVSHDHADEHDVAKALATFGPAWDVLGPREQGRLVQLLVEQVTYDGAKGTVSLTFRPNGIKHIANQTEIAA